MAWQDLVLTGGQFILFLALMPSVFGKDKPAMVTCLLTGTILAIFAGTFFTLGLTFTTFPTILSSLTWFLLAYQESKRRT